MASHLKSLGSSSPASHQVDYSHRIIGIAVSAYHIDITRSLLNACLGRLMEAGVLKCNVIVLEVPGAFELPLGCKKLITAKHRQRHIDPAYPANRLSQVGCDAVIALGCIIQGETRHFDFIAQAVAQGCMDLSLEHSIPVAFGVLTVNSLEQAQDRTGGKYGNKGIEAADAVLAMLAV